MEIKNALNKHHFSFSKRFGQNFITDTNFLCDLVKLSGIDGETEVLEIGAGAGTLTSELSKKAKRVVSYEIDGRLKPVLNDLLGDVKNIEFIFEDVMKISTEDVEKHFDGSYTLIANLPYYITTPIIFKFIEEAKKIDALIIMVQEEVAARICAKEGTPDYGAITPAIDLVGNAEIIKKVSRNMFYPVPNVDSAVVKISIVGNKFQVDREVYRRVVRCAFASRRKTLVNNLMREFFFEREQTEEILSSLDIDVKIRGECLSTKQFAQLANTINSREK